MYCTCAVYSHLCLPIGDCHILIQLVNFTNLSAYLIKHNNSVCVRYEVVSYISSLCHAASTHLNQLFEGDYPKLVRLFTYLPEYIHRQLTSSGHRSATTTTTNTYTTGGSDNGVNEFNR